MQATGFTGKTKMFGRTQRVCFTDEGVLSFDNLNLNEAQLITELVERGAATLASRGKGKTAAPAKTSAPAEDDAPDPTPEEEREAIQAVEKEEEERIAKEEAAAKKKADAEAKKKAAAKKKADAEKEKKRKAAEAAKKKAEAAAAAAEAAAAEAEAAADEENYEADEGEAESEADEGAAEEPAADPVDLDDIPDEIKNAKHVRNVVSHLKDELGIDTAEAAVEWCTANQENIAVLKRIGARLPERVGRAWELIA